MSTSNDPLADVMDSLRRSDPDLDRAIRESEPRRRLALALTRLRVSADITQADMAAEMGWSREDLSLLESSLGAWPSRETLRAYAEICLRHQGSHCLESLDIVVQNLLELMPLQNAGG